MSHRSKEVLSPEISDRSGAAPICRSTGPGFRRIGERSALAAVAGFTGILACTPDFYRVIDRLRGLFLSRGRKTAQSQRHKSMLLVVTAVALALSLAPATAGPIEGSEQWKLQQDQKAALQALRDEYRILANEPQNQSDSLQHELLERYSRAAENIRQEFLSKDTRAQMIEDAQRPFATVNDDGSITFKSRDSSPILTREYTDASGNRIYKDANGNVVAGPQGKQPQIVGEIANTGSNPKDVRSDVDLAAASEEAAQKLAASWREQGHDVDMSNPTKIVDKTTDTTLWRPCDSAECQKLLVEDSDAFSTEGGRQGTGVPDRIRDPEGWLQDNAKKFNHGKEWVQDGNLDEGLKTISKSLDKAASTAGMKDDDPLWAQGEDFRNYKDPVEAGVANLKDSPDQEMQNVIDWVNNASGKMGDVADRLTQLGSITRQVRQALQEALDNSQPFDPEAALQNKIGADNIANRQSLVDQSNAAAAAENAKHGNVRDPLGSPGTGQEEGAAANTPGETPPETPSAAAQTTEAVASAPPAAANENIQNGNVREALGSPGQQKGAAATTPAETPAEAPSAAAQLGEAVTLGAYTTLATCLAGGNKTIDCLKSSAASGGIGAACFALQQLAASPAGGAAPVVSGTVGLVCGAVAGYKACVLAVRAGDDPNKCVDQARQSMSPTVFCASIGLLNPAAGAICGSVAPSAYEAFNALKEEEVAEEQERSNMAGAALGIGNLVKDCNYTQALGLLNLDTAGRQNLPRWVTTVRSTLQQLIAIQDAVDSIVQQAYASNDPAQTQQLMNKALAAAGNYACLRARVPSWANPANQANNSSGSSPPPPQKTVAATGGGSSPPSSTGCTCNPTATNMDCLYSDGSQTPVLPVPADAATLAYYNGYQSPMSAVRWGDCNSGILYHGYCPSVHGNASLGISKFLVCVPGRTTPAPVASKPMTNIICGYYAPFAGPIPPGGVSGTGQTFGVFGADVCPATWCLNNDQSLPPAYVVPAPPGTACKPNQSLGKLQYCATRDSVTVLCPSYGSTTPATAAATPSQPSSPVSSPVPATAAATTSQPKSAVSAPVPATAAATASPPSSPLSALEPPYSPPMPPLVPQPSMPAPNLNSGSSPAVSSTDPGTSPPSDAAVNSSPSAAAGAAVSSRPSAAPGAAVNSGAAVVPSVATPATLPFMPSVTRAVAVPSIILRPALSSANAGALPVPTTPAPAPGQPSAGVASGECHISADGAQRICTQNGQVISITPVSTQAATAPSSLVPVIAPAIVPVIANAVPSLVLRPSTPPPGTSAATNSGGSAGGSWPAGSMTTRSATTSSPSSTNSGITLQPTSRLGTSSGASSTPGSAAPAASSPVKQSIGYGSCNAQGVCTSTSRTVNTGTTTSSPSTSSPSTSSSSNSTKATTTRSTASINSGTSPQRTTTSGSTRGTLPVRRVNPTYIPRQPRTVGQQQASSSRPSFGSGHGGGFGGGGFGGGGGGFAGGRHPSDVRLKEDIVPLGRLDNGIGVYRFRYRGEDHTAYVGVMAQEVQTIVPNAVSQGPDGYLRVDYDRLGLRFLTWDEWVARGGTPSAAMP